MSEIIGRPTKWTEDTLKKVESYYKLCLEDVDKVPKVSELCILLDITRETLNQWQDDVTKPLSFSDTIKKIMALQQDRLIQRGLDKKGTPIFEIFLLKVNHGMNETNKVDVTTKGDKLQSLSLTDVIKELKNKSDNDLQREAGAETDNQEKV